MASRDLLNNQIRQEYAYISLPASELVSPAEKQGICGFFPRYSNLPSSEAGRTDLIGERRVSAVKPTERPEYSICIGLDTELLLRANSQWTSAKAAIIESLRRENDPLPKDVAQLTSLFVNYGLADFHWDWTRKALACNSDEYIWMFLVTSDERIQAIAVLFHPKSSRFDGLDIFYIDYIATAYWNRGKDRQNAEFPGAASLLIRASIRHVAASHGYREGFSLHSLPSAISFYEKIGMTKFEEDAEKENLVYFEATHDVALAIASGD